jgi:hypothetical protein
VGLTLIQQALKLCDAVQTINLDEGKRRVNDAYLDVCQMFSWSHLLKRWTLQTEPQYNTGTIACLNATQAVTLTGGTWVTSWVTAPSNRKMMIGGRNEPYDVSGIGSTTALTIADPLVGGDITAATYALYRDVYPLPADCGYAKLLALYDPDSRSGWSSMTDRGRLRFYLQMKFLRERARNPTLTGVPWCFTLINQSSETPPRPQIQIYPASTDVRVYHGWYFRRPAALTADAQYFDWPAEFDDMLWTKAAIAYYQNVRTFSQRFVQQYMLLFDDNFRRAKKELNGQAAMDVVIEGTRQHGESFAPTFAGSTATGEISWG